MGFLVGGSDLLLHNVSTNAHPPTDPGSLFPYGSVGRLAGSDRTLAVLVVRGLCAGVICFDNYPGRGLGYATLAFHPFDGRSGFRVVLLLLLA